MFVPASSGSSSVHLLAHGHAKINQDFLFDAILSCKCVQGMTYTHVRSPVRREAEHAEQGEASH